MTEKGEFSGQLSTGEIDQLTAFLSEKDLTYQQIADTLKITKTAAWLFLTKKRPMPISQARKLCRAHGADIKFTITKRNT
jgi:hypothetical protein